MADDLATAAAASSSTGDDEDDEGTDTDASNSDRDAPYPQDAAPNAQDAAPTLPDATQAPPPPPLPQAQGAGAAAEDSRRLFQRLWTDEEELLILRGFHDFTARRGTAFASHQYDTGPFYEEIRRRLSFDFTKSQLIEKLRRLKKKYRVCAARMAAQGATAFAFRSAHEGAIYDVARHIWRPSFSRGDADGEGDGAASDDDDIGPAAAAAVVVPGAMDDAGVGSLSASASTPRGSRGSRRVRRRTAQDPDAPALPPTPTLTSTNVAQDTLVASVESLAPAIAVPPPVVIPAPAPVTPTGATEEAFRAIFSPLLRELVSSVATAGHTGQGLGFGIGFGGGDIPGPFGVAAGPNHGVPGDEKWRQQQILELEVYLKRIELVREQVTAVLEELKSSEG